MPIKMTKELPTEDGHYYYKSNHRDKIDIVTVYLRDTVYGQVLSVCFMPIENMGGYWAKVDKDQFEFEE